MQANRRAILGLALLGPVAGFVRADPSGDAVDFEFVIEPAKVGETALLTARVRPRAGITIASNYRNRVSSLSSLKRDVRFPSDEARKRATKVPVLSQ